MASRKLSCRGKQQGSRRRTTAIDEIHNQKFPRGRDKCELVLIAQEWERKQTK